MDMEGLKNVLHYLIRSPIPKTTQKNTGATNVAHDKTMHFDDLLNSNM